MSAPKVDFTDTKTAFEHQSDSELWHAHRMFSVMNKAWLVSVSAPLGLAALKLGLPIKGIVRGTLYKQFVGGRDLNEAKETIQSLAKFNALTILDYGAEAKTSMAEFEKTKEEFLRAITFADEHHSVPVITIKVTGLGHKKLLEKLDAHEALSKIEELQVQNMRRRLDEVCSVAVNNRVGVFVDAEESWMQGSIDEMVNEMMAKYNRDRVVIYNTYQMYRHDRLDYLKTSHQHALENGYMIGAKLVRGAYMDKERARAEELDYPSPIQVDKAATDQDFNAAIDYCLEHYETISLCNATHNAESCMHMVDEIERRQLKRDHIHLNFCQLYGMSDHITFNLAKAGYNAAKYVPYGPVSDVMPYLIRRAQENSSVTGDISRELSLIDQEVKRRKTEK